MALPTVVQLIEYTSGEFFERIDRTTGNYYQVGEIRGNSVLSSIFVESLDVGASIKVNYFDTTTGPNVGEHYDLTSHDLIDGTSGPFPKTFRILVSKIHHRIVCEAVVTGNTKFSVYATAVPTSTSDLDQALIRDGDSFEQPTDKALSVAVLDDTEQRLYFLRGSKGVLSVSEDFGVANPLRSGSVSSIQNSTVVLISELVPALKKWRIRRLEAQSRVFGYFTVWLDAVQVAKSNSGPASENPKFEFAPFENAAAGQTLEVRFTQSFGPIADISAFLFTSEFNS